MMKGNVRSRDDVADVIRNVLVTQKNALTVGMPVAQLESEYREMEGIRIPFRELGYPCLKDFLESLENSDDIVLGKRGSMNVVFPRLNEKVAHISALVCGQKDSSKRRPRGGKRVTHRSYPRQMYQPPRLDSKMLADVVHVIKGAPNGVHVDKLLEYLRDRRIHSVDKHELIRQLQGVSHEISIGNDMIYPIMKKQPQQQQQQQRPSQNIGNSTNGFAEKKSSGGFRPAGFSDSDEDDDFQLVKNAIKNPTETQKRNEIREESKFAAPPIDENANACLREDENCHLAAEEDVGMLVNDRTRFRLEKLIQRYPNGIWCADLPDLYQKEYSIPLNYQDLGFDSVSDYAAHLPAIFHCVQLQDKGDFKLFDAKSPKPEERPTARPARLSLAALHNVYPSYYDQDEPVPVSLSSSITQRLVPEGVMTVGETVAQIFVTELFPDESQTIGVVVVDIITPSFFWIHLFEKANKFYRFMLELHEFYSQHAKKYVIPIVLLERGLNCACIYDNKWHRGVIKAVRPNNTVTIMFYDYGTVMSYSPQDIHFLHRSFSNVPAQAIPCGLYNVKPKNTAKWPKSVCQAFVDRVVDVPLVATLGSLDADNNSMLIALTDTEGENDFHINDWMVNSGLAVYGKMVCIRPPNYPFRRFLECKYGTTIDKENRALNCVKIVRSAKKDNNAKTSAAVPKETVGRLSFYDKLLKLHQKSGNNSLEAPVSNQTVENLSFYNQLLKLRRKSGNNSLEAPVSNQTVENLSFYNQLLKLHRKSDSNSLEASDKTNSANQPTTRHFSHNKEFGTNLLKKLCEAHSNRMAAMNVSSSSDSGTNTHDSSSNSSCASLILLNSQNTRPTANSPKDANVENKRVNEIPRSSMPPKRNANLLKLLENRSKALRNPNSDARGRDEKIRAKPLHLRDEIPERQNVTEEFGAFHCQLGGHGRMEPIDWEKARGGREENFSDRSPGKSRPQTSATSPENNSQPKHVAALPKHKKSVIESANTCFESSKPSIATKAPRNTNSDARGRDEKNRAKPLHLRDEIPERQNVTEEFGAFHCQLGGHGRMEPIDWEKARGGREENFSDRTSGKSRPQTSATSPENNSQPKHSAALPKPQKSEIDSANTHFESSKPPFATKTEKKVSATLERARLKQIADRKSSMKTKIPESEKNSKVTRDSETKIVDRKSSTKTETKESAKNSKLTSEPETQTADSSAIPKTSKLPPAKKAFLNFVLENNEKKQALPEFGDFYSRLGGNGRMEPIAWNDFRKVVERSEKIVAKSVEKTPVVLPPARKAFLNVVNSGLPAGNERESFCLPEGNIKRREDLSPTLRKILKKVNEDRGDKHLRLYIPDDVAELLRDGDDTSASPTSPSVSSSFADNEGRKSFDIDLPDARIKSSVKYQNLGRSGTCTKRGSSEPASTESESSPANDTGPDFDSSYDASGASSEDVIKSAEKLLKSSDLSDTRDTSPVRVSGEIQLEEVALVSEAREEIDAGESRELQTTNDDLETESQSGKSSARLNVADKHSVSDCPGQLSGTAGKSTNAWIQNSYVKSNSTLLEKYFQLIGASRNYTDDSNLDSDDLSFEEVTRKKDSPRLESSAKTVDEPLQEKSRQVSTDSYSSMEKLDDKGNEESRNSQVFRKLGNTDSPPKNTEDNSLQLTKLDAKDNEESGNSQVFRKLDNMASSPKNTEDNSVRLTKLDAKDNEESGNSQVFRKLDNMASLPKNNEDNSLQLTTIQVAKYLPVFDDTCQDSDSDEWDFSPSSQVTHLLQKEIADQPLPQQNGRLDNCLTWEDSSSEEKDVLSEIKTNQRGSSSPEDYLTDENRSIDCDKLLNSTDESIEDDNDSSNIPNQCSYSILSQVQKCNISAAADVLANVSSTDSGSTGSELNDNSYTKSLMNALKHYL